MARRNYWAIATLSYYAALFLIYFLILPILEASDPSLRGSFSYIPFFFIFPFFWGLGGSSRRNVRRSQQNQQPDSTQQTSTDYATADAQPVFEQFSTLPVDSQWRLVWIVGAIAVIAIAAAIIYFTF